MGFSDPWISRVMAFVRATRFSVIINGQPSAFFTPSRGLRQGFPLSPYLFLLCTHGLSYLIKIRVINGALSGIRCHRLAPTITHLFFVDDTLLFGEVDRVSCENLREIMQVYENASGQLINLNKYSITFSPSS